MGWTGKSANFRCNWRDSEKKKKEFKHLVETHIGRVLGTLILNLVLTLTLILSLAKSLTLNPTNLNPNSNPNLTLTLTLNFTFILTFSLTPPMTLGDHGFTPSSLIAKLEEIESREGWTWARDGAKEIVSLLQEVDSFVLWSRSETLTQNSNPNPNPNPKLKGHEKESGGKPEKLA